MKRLAHTILLIEDDNHIRENISELLELEGYTVLLGENGYQGLKLAESYLPDLIICDVIMPEMNGIEVLEGLRGTDETATIPVIFCSAQTQRTEIEKGWDAGVVAYITKPYDEETLLNEIRSLLR